MFHELQINHTFTLFLKIEYKEDFFLTENVFIKRTIFLLNESAHNADDW